MPEKNSVICLMGPTACGKTALAIEWAQQHPVEIISVDSAMIYRGMNIGTAKPGADILQIAPHHLIDICDPLEIYSAADFASDATTLINDIISRNKIPLLVGGTLLYFRALQKPLADLPSRNEKIRERLNQQAEQFGWPALHEKLKLIDPKSAERIHPNDNQRLQRALEVYEITGQPLTTLWENDNSENPLHFINFAIVPDRQLLHQRIAKRVHQMLDEGLIAEVEMLYQRGDLSLDLPSMRSVGYRQVWQYLAGSISRKDLNDQIIFATRQFAKRQYSGLRLIDNLQIIDNTLAPDLLWNNYIVCS